MRILVTGSGPGGHGEQITKALRASEMKSYEIFCADANQNLVNGNRNDTFSLPFASDPNYIPALLELCKLLEIEALFHGSEPEMISISQSRSLFEEQGIYLAMNESDLISLCTDKAALSNKLAELGISSPKFKLATRAEVDSLGSDWYPVVVKPAKGGGGSRDVFICQDRTELIAIFTYLTNANSAAKLLIQQYVGNPEQEFTVGVLHSSSGQFLGSAVLNRDLQSNLSMRQKVRNNTSKEHLGEFLVISSGVSQGSIGDFEEVAQECRSIAEQLGSRGPMNIQLRMEAGHVSVFEINPRFSGTTSIRALAGFNEPDLLLRADLLFQDVGPISHPQSGRLVRRLHESFTPTTTVSP